MDHEPTPEEAAAIAEKIRTGEFFREGRAIYDLTVHDVMAERYLYILITALSGLILFITFSATQALYPLRTPVPFIVNATDIYEEMPRIATLLGQEGEDPSQALLRFLVNNYVALHEEYDIDSFDRNISGVRSQSSDAVFTAFQAASDPHNPESPIAQYQRHSKRRVDIVSSKLLSGDEPQMEVIFEATVEGRGEVKKSRWQANIDFIYSGIALDKNSGKVKPLNFIVTQYRAKRIQDIQ